jgi:hypothetical protein
MKNFKIIILIALNFVATTIFAQTAYFVLGTRGTVKIKKTGLVLKPNSPLSERDVIAFSSPRDAVMIVNTKNVRFVLKPKPNAKSPEQLTSMVSEVLNPGTVRFSKPSGSIANVNDLKKYFSEDSLNVLGSSKVWLSPKAYQMNQSQFFFVRYVWNNEVFNKKLLFERDSILLTANEVYKVDMKVIDARDIQDATLYYKQNTTVTEICPFTIAFPDEVALKEMVLAFKKHTTAKGNDFIEELVALLSDAYGRTDKENVRKWVKVNIGTY